MLASQQIVLDEYLFPLYKIWSTDCLFWQKEKPERWYAQLPYHKSGDGFHTGVYLMSI